MVELTVRQGGVETQEVKNRTHDSIPQPAEGFKRADGVNTVPNVGLGEVLQLQ
jgi:hypothetical protein